MEQEEKTDLAYQEYQHHQQRVIVLSDIHADLEAFLICLRDCATVIKKKDGYDFVQQKPDADLYRQLHYPTIHHPDYVDDLHYEWIGNDTIVVIIGDLIDGARENESVKKSPSSIEEMGYYPQIEIKLLRFINAINRHASTHGNGGIIKVIGNHDYENFKGNIDMMDSYLFTPDRDPTTTYYTHPETLETESRYTFFQFGHEGYKLYQDTLGMYLFYRLGDMLFIHGQLPSSSTIEQLSQQVDEHVTILDTLDRINQLVRIPYTTAIGTELETYDAIIEEMLWTRTYGDLDERGDQSPEQFEIMFKQHMLQCTGSDHMRLFIGHCQQHTVHYMDEPQIRSTLGHLCYRDDIIEVYDNSNLYTGPPDTSCLTENRVFGIVTECLLPQRDHLHQPQLIKVDVAMSRGQEYIDEYKLLQEGKCSEIQYFLPKAPQVVEVIGSIMRIRRCQLRNMFHMDRKGYHTMNKPYKSIWNTTYKKIRKSPVKQNQRKPSPRKIKIKNKSSNQ